MAKDSLGVAYSMKRRNKKPQHAESLPQAPAKPEVSENEDIVDAIMAKRKYASGGMVEDAGQVDDKFMPINQFSEHGDPNDVDSPGPDIDNESDDQKLVAQILKDRKAKRG